MELKISETEINTLLEGLEKLLEKHDERIITAINTAAGKLGNTLDEIETGVSSIYDTLDDEFSNDADDDEEDDDLYYVEEMTSDSHGLRILIVTDADDDISDYVVLENTGKWEVDDINDVIAFYDACTVSCVKIVHSEDEAIAYMNELKATIDSGVYSVYDIYNDEMEPWMLVIVTGDKHAKAEKMAFAIVDYYNYERGKKNLPNSMSYVNSELCKALGSDHHVGNYTAKVLCVGDLETCTKAYEERIAEARGGGVKTDK